MKCAIMQPTYIPWAGYFNLLAEVDVFVILDDVQAERQSWQTRNRVLVGGNECMLSVPLKRTGLETLIQDAQIDYGRNWTGKHGRTIAQAYNKASHKMDVLDLLTPILESKPAGLADLNVPIIQQFAERLGLNTPVKLASTLGCEGVRSEKVANICKAVGASEYLSPEGARDYLEEDQFESRYGITLHFQQYHPESYSQIGSKEFVSHLSIVDVVANIGFEGASNYVR